MAVLQSTPYNTRKAQEKKAKAKPKPKPKKALPYDPLAMLTGERARQERQAAENLQFQPREAELQQARGAVDQTAVNRAAYYDDYTRALHEAAGRIEAANQQAIEQSAQRVYTANDQDRVALAARNQAASAASENLGRGPVSSEEGARALDAQRAMGLQGVSRLMGQSAADTTLTRSREANSLLKKVEDQQRLDTRREALRKEQAALEKSRGDFRVNFDTKNRQSEREWAAVQSEFNLKSRAERAKEKADAAARNDQASKNRTQVLVARIYGSASKAKARAQVRVAKLQLEKGKIDQNQYTHVLNTYENLPSNHGKNKSQGGSGAGGSLAPWEKDKVTNALNVLTRNNAVHTDKAKWLKRMQDAGVPLRLARIAWSRYDTGARAYSKGSGKPD